LAVWSQVWNSYCQGLNNVGSSLAKLDKRTRSILYRYRLGGLEYLTIVECKHWKESGLSKEFMQIYRNEEFVAGLLRKT